jgi:hypothetical protein
MRKKARNSNRYDKQKMRWKKSFFVQLVVDNRVKVIRTTNFDRVWKGIGKNKEKKSKNVL